jgi:hypothetical protein
VAGECPGGWGYGLGGSLSLFLDVAYLSAGFRPDFLVSTQAGPCCGGDRAAGGFAFRRGYAVACGRFYGGVLLTVAAVGVFLSVVGGGVQVFSSAPVVAAVSAALWCRDWRLVPSVAASLLAARRVTVGVGVRLLERLGRGGGQRLLKGSGISYKLPLIHGAASHHLKRNCLPALTL